VSDDRKSPHNWESAIDKQIREAMERGEFNNLRGAGKPLNLDDNPHTPNDWKLAFKVLKDAGYAPEWIEQGKEIRAELQSLAAFLEQQVRWQHERRAQLAALAPGRQPAERTRLAEARERTCRVYRQRATALNKAIDTFNLKVPNINLQLPRVRVEEKVQQFEEACS
jgi:DnaJ homolog subfamily C member 28